MVHGHDVEQPVVVEHAEVARVSERGQNSAVVEEVENYFSHWPVVRMQERQGVTQLFAHLVRESRLLEDGVVIRPVRVPFQSRVLLHLARRDVCHDVADEHRLVVGAVSE